MTVIILREGEVGLGGVIKSAWVIGDEIAVVRGSFQHAKVECRSAIVDSVNWDLLTL